IQEQWHGPGGWRGFFDTTSKLNLPEVALVTTGSAPDTLLESEDPAAAEPTTGVPENMEPTAGESPIADEAGIEPVATEAPTEADAVSAELPDIPPAPPIEAAAVIEPLALEGSSDQMVSTVAQAAPSRIALDGARLGSAVSTTLA